MFVYLLRFAEEPYFKIGKANDIYQRIPGIGGGRAFDLANSLCIQLSSEDKAYQLEKVLHRLFERWRMPVSGESERYSGDTEQYEVACFDRVLQFLADNTDLTNGAFPTLLPPQPALTENKNLRVDRRDFAAIEGKFISVTDIQRRAKEVFKHVGDGKKFSILKNNEIVAVLIAAKQYEELEDELRQLRLNAMATTR